MRIAPFKPEDFSGLKGKIKVREPLKKHTTFRIGGPARLFVEPADIADLKLLIVLAKRYNIPILVIGAGSNILASDKGVNAVVLRLNSPFFRGISRERNFLNVGSGTGLKELLMSARGYCLAGAEFLAGIPGTVGGALIMNAGAWGRSIGDLVSRVTVMDYKGGVKKLTKKEIGFAYRRSGLEKYIILNATLKLGFADKGAIDCRIKKYLKSRSDTQDRAFPSAGCIFKNPLRQSAGRLIEECGLKGRRINKAYVSLRHANFILNSGGASARDVLRLMGLIKKMVKEKFRLTLEPEIKIWR